MNHKLRGAFVDLCACVHADRKLPLPAKKNWTKMVKHAEACMSLIDEEVESQHTNTEDKFDGPAYDPGLDDPRLDNQLYQIFEHMRDGKWRTLDQIVSLTGFPEGSIAAQLRHLRKPKHGVYRMDRRKKWGSGLHEYRVLSPKGKVMV